MTPKTRGGLVPCPLAGGGTSGPCGSKRRLAKNVAACRHCSGNGTAAKSPVAAEDFDSIFSSLEDTSLDSEEQGSDSEAWHDEPGAIYEFPASRMDEAVAKIDAANRRLERGGIKERFTYNVDYTTSRTSEGIPYKKAYLTLNRPDISYNGWKFMARVDVAEGGTILSAPKGINTDDLPRPEAHVCDHCGTKRSRKRSYLLRNEDGEYKHIGHSCLDMFLGVSPSGLWTLNQDILGDLEEEMDDERVLQDNRMYPVRDILAVAHRVSKGGEEHCSASVARETGTHSTADTVRAVLQDNIEIAPLSDEEVATIKKYASTATGGYGENLRAVLNSDMVDKRHLALVTSAVRAAYLARSREQEESRNRTNSRTVEELSTLYPSGSKTGAFPATVVSSRTFEGYGYNGPTMMTALVFENEDGDQFTWMTGSAKAKLSPGTKVDVIRATVKGHKDYRGTASTHLKNVGLKPSAT